MSRGRQPLAVSEGSMYEVLDYCQIFFSFAKIQGSDVVITMCMHGSHYYNTLLLFQNKHKCPGKPFSIWFISTIIRGLFLYEPCFIYSK